MTVATRRVDRSTVVFAASAAIALVGLVWLGRGLTFFSDEWAFIEHRSLGDPGTWLPPHNEHWTTVPLLVYRGLVETVGLVSYVPYLLVNALLHVLVACLVFRLVARRAGRVTALVVGTVVLWFGSGFENLYWGFQLGFVGATAAGLAALDILDRRPTRAGTIGVAALLTVGVASAGIGLVFVVVVGLEALVRSGLRRAASLVAVPIGAYALWYLAYGRYAIVAHRNPFSLDSILHVPEFVVRGFGSAVGAITGVGPLVGLVVAAALVLAATVLLARRQRVPPRLIAAAAGVAVLYGLIGLTRAEVTPNQVEYSRYTYVGGILLIVGLASWLGPMLAAMSPTRWQRLALIVVTVGLFELAMIWNVRLLIEGRELFLERAAMTRALVTVAISPERPPGIDLDRSLVLVPSPAQLERIVASHGSPLGDVVFPDAVEPIPSDTLAEAERRLIYGAPIPGLDD